MNRRVPVGLLVLVSGSLLVGCSHHSDGTEPTATTTVPVPSTAPAVEVTTPPPDPEQVDTDNAIAAYENYVQVRDAVRQDYFNGWEEKVLPLTSGDEADWVAWYFSQGAQYGQHQVGSSAVGDVFVDEYSPDPTGAGHEQVVLRVCLDNSGIQSLDPSGTNQLDPTGIGRFWTAVIMQRQTNFDGQGQVMEDPYGWSWWRVASEKRDRGSSC